MIRIGDIIFSGTSGKKTLYKYRQKYFTFELRIPLGHKIWIKEPDTRTEERAP